VKKGIPQDVGHGSVLLIPKKLPRPFPPDGPPRKAIRSQENRKESMKYEEWFRLSPRERQYLLEDNLPD